MAERITFTDLIPAPPPYPPLPRFLFMGGNPEFPEFPRAAQEAEDIVGSAFEGIRTVHSVMQTRRTIDRLLREPTTIWPFGERE